MRLLVRLHEIDAAGKARARPTPQAIITGAHEDPSKLFKW